MKRAVLVLLGCVCSVPIVSAQPLVGIEWSGDLVEIDPSNGSQTRIIGGTGWAGLNALTRNPITGDLFAASGPTLLSIDPATAAAAPVATIVFPIGTQGMVGLVGGMAFSSSGTLYAVVSGISSMLYTIDVLTGVATFVGFTGLQMVQSIAFDPTTNILYAYDNFLGLVRLNTTTGLATNVNFQVFGQASQVQSMCFSRGGVLFGARWGLVTIETVTGLLTPAGSGTPLDDIRGLAAPTWGAPDFQVNQPAATLVTNGVATTGFLPATMRSTVGTSFPFFLQSSVPGGAVWEVGVTAEPLRPRGGGSTLIPGGELINLDLSSANLRFLNGGFSPSGPLLTLSQGVAVASAPASFSTQMAVLDPTAFFGLSLSQGTQLVIN